MTSRIRIICFLIVLLALSFQADFAQAQERPLRRTVGLTGSIQSSQVNILVPIWVGDKATVAPGLGLIYIEDVGADLRLLLAPRFYTMMTRVAPYIGARAAALFSIPDVGSNTVDFLIGLAFGGEYFVNPKFSFGVEAQLNAQIPDNASARVGPPGKIVLSTAGAVHVNVYF